MTGAPGGLVPGVSGGRIEGEDPACLLHSPCSQQLLHECSSSLNVLCNHEAYSRMSGTVRQLTSQGQGKQCWPHHWFPRAGGTATLEEPRRPDR